MVPREPAEAHQCHGYGQPKPFCKSLEFPVGVGNDDAAASMIGPDLYEEFLWSAQQRVFSFLEERHPQVIRRQHLCGNTDPLAR